MIRICSSIVVLLLITSLAIAGETSRVSVITIINKSKSDIDFQFEKDGAKIPGNFVVKKKTTRKFNLPYGNLKMAYDPEGSAMSYAFTPITLDSNGNKTFVCTHWKNKYGQDNAGCEP